MSFYYAYYRFGEQVLTALPPELQRTVRRFRQLYDMGLHGPEILRYPPPLRAVAAANVRKKYRGQSAKAFFERAGRTIRLHPSEGATVYLYGLMAHYAFASVTAPYLARQVAAGHARSAVTTEFDRYLLELDGKGPAHLYDRSIHIRLTPGECATVAGFYPPATAGLVESCTQNMAQRVRALTPAPGVRRDLLEKALTAGGKESAGLLMPLRGGTVGRKWDPDLMRLSELAAARYAVLVEQMGAYLRRGTPLGTDFSGYILNTEE